MLGSKNKSCKLRQTLDDLETSKLLQRASEAKERISQATSCKRQAPSFKLQAASYKLWRYKRQASSSKLQAPGYLKPSLTRSCINLPSKSFMVPGPRAWTKIKVFFGCLSWKLIWCGLNLILFAFVVFNSIVKKWPEALQTNRSGVPSKLEFSSLMSEKSVKHFLIFWYNLRSGPIGFSSQRRHSFSSPSLVYLAK